MSHTQAHTPVSIVSLTEMRHLWQRAKWAAIEAERLHEEGQACWGVLELARFLELTTWNEYVRAAALVDALSKAVQS